MSSNNVNQIRLSPPSNQVQPVRERHKKMLIAGITVLVISIIGFLIGMSLLSYGITLALTGFIILGTGLIGISVLGILIAGLLVGLTHHREILRLEEENYDLFEDWRKSSKLETEISTRQEDRIAKINSELAKEVEKNSTLCEQLSYLHKSSTETLKLQEEKVALWKEKEARLNRDLEVKREENQKLSLEVQVLRKSMQVSFSPDVVWQQREKYLLSLEDKIKVLEKRRLEAHADARKSMPQYILDQEKVNKEAAEQNRRDKEEIQKERRSLQLEKSQLKERRRLLSSVSEIQEEEVPEDSEEPVKKSEEDGN